MVVGCGSPPEPATAAPVPPAKAAPAEPSSRWPESTWSPHETAPSDDPRVVSLLAKCGHPDGAFMRAAASEDSANDVESLLRELGSPALRPRLISARGLASDDALGTKLTSMHSAHTRCGIATRGSGTDVVTTVVSAEMLADLAPLPVRARTGAWLTLEAAVHVPAQKATVVVMGARGAPKTFPTSLEPGRGGDASRVRARFPLDRPGGFTIQLVADVDGGPRPLLEARVFADVSPQRDAERAPGEDAGDLERMIAAARVEEGLQPLRRDPRLDALAAAHAERMHGAGAVAHDLGDGDLAERFQAEGYAAAVVGENVARAATLPLVHRALYASPSHRLNLLSAQYTRLGIATVTDGPRIYACEVFSSELR